MRAFIRVRACICICACVFMRVCECACSTALVLQHKPYRVNAQTWRFDKTSLSSTE